MSCHHARVKGSQSELGMDREKDLRLGLDSDPCSLILA